MKKALYVSLAALTLLGSAVGCIGKNHPFALFTGLHSWNKRASDNEWVNEVLFLALNIIPVYGLFLFADVLVFNSIDFWTGDNPVKGAFAAAEGTDGQGNAYAIVPNADGTATLSYRDQVCTLSRQGKDVVISQNGVTLGTVSRQGSLLTLTTPDGATRSVLR